MTRIGFAYNQKPDSNPLHLTDAESPRTEDEPSSRRRKWTRRTRVAEPAPGSDTVIAERSAPAPESPKSGLHEHSAYSSLTVVR